MDLPFDPRIPEGDQVAQVPGEHRNALRRIIVTQGDTEPASVEQQRLLSNSAPSLYDCRNLFQVNVEEGRHLWAMVYLLHSHFYLSGRQLRIFQPPGKRTIPNRRCHGITLK
jgi:1,2-phenylacetyl-CoA epoxidase catalytic subunit